MVEERRSIYCLDVETFIDWNGDGIGDFPGLTERIDYLAELGVSCLWLMPFQPTPDRDDGYDITDFYGVDPRLGSLGDFVTLITAAEDLGIGSRAGYYDAAGALRDLVQNHMLQLLTLVCMEPPTTFEANKVRDEKVKVLQAIEPPTPERGGGDDGPRPLHGGRGGRRARRRATSRRRASRRTRTPRPTRPCGSRSTTGAGPACRSSCAPASGSRARSPRSRSSSSRCRTWRSSPRARSACSPTS